MAVGDFIDGKENVLKHTYIQTVIEMVFVRFGLNYVQKGQVVGIVCAGSVTIHSSGQTISSFPSHRRHRTECRLLEISGLDGIGEVDMANKGHAGRVYVTGYAASSLAGISNHPPLPTSSIAPLISSPFGSYIFSNTAPPTWHICKCLLLMDKGFCEVEMSVHLL